MIVSMPEWVRLDSRTSRFGHAPFLPWSRLPHLVMRVLPGNIDMPIKRKALHFMIIYDHDHEHGGSAYCYYPRLGLIVT